ncbi:MAG TPA: TonB family protein [Steroidobacteraceae bacterium]|jgi:TonB family protein|nr:TonB family protein [Steroidobacteraceae bacterium]
MLPQSEFEPPMLANAAAPVAIAAITQDRALIGLLRSVVDPSNDLILVSSETELTPHLNSRRVSVALLDSMFIEADLGAMAERLRATWPDLVLVVVGTAEEQSKVAAQITTGVVYRFLHRPVSAPRVRLFVDAALRRHEVENVERTLEQTRPDFSKFEGARSRSAGSRRGALIGVIAAIVIVAAGGAWYALSSGGARPSVADSDSAAPVVSAPVEAPASKPAAAAVPPVQRAEAAPVATPAPAPAAVVAAPPPAVAEESVAERLRPAKSMVAPVVQVPEEIAPRTPPPAPAPTFEQRLREQLVQAEAALQRGELASPPGRNAVALFMGALELDPGNTLAKAGLVRVADRLLSAAERALTAGSVEDARKMVDVAETLTPATARGAFLMMQIEREHERAALTRAKDSDAQDKQTKGDTYLRLANARLRSGALIEPSEDNARFYLDAARQIVPDDPALDETSRALQKQLLDRAATAASSGDAADTERWLANADSAGAARQEMTGIRRALQDTLIGARAGKMTSLTQSFATALAAQRLVQPAGDSAKSYLLALINTDAGNPAVASARQGLSSAYLNEMHAAVARNDLVAADAWLNETRTIGFTGEDLKTAEAELVAARDKAAEQNSVVGAGSLQRIEYVAPKFPSVTRNRAASGWVELEFTVRTDGSTGDIVVTNANPRKTFDNAAMTAVGEWRYKPVLRDGKPVEQRAAVRIRFSGE